LVKEGCPEGGVVDTPYLKPLMHITPRINVNSAAGGVVGQAAGQKYQGGSLLEESVMQAHNKASYL
jgi:hypothetical protein